MVGRCRRRGRRANASAVEVAMTDHHSFQSGMSGVLGLYSHNKGAQSLARRKTGVTVFCVLYVIWGASGVDQRVDQRVGQRVGQKVGQRVNLGVGLGVGLRVGLRGCEGARARHRRNAPPQRTAATHRRNAPPQGGQGAPGVKKLVFRQCLQVCPLCAPLPLSSRPQSTAVVRSPHACPVPECPTRGRGCTNP